MRRGGVGGEVWVFPEQFDTKMETTITQTQNAPTKCTCDSARQNQPEVAWARNEKNELKVKIVTKSWFFFCLAYLIEWSFLYNFMKFAKKYWIITEILAFFWDMFILVFTKSLNIERLVRSGISRRQNLTPPLTTRQWLWLVDASWHVWVCVCCMSPLRCQYVARTEFQKRIIPMQWCMTACIKLQYCACVNSIAHWPLLLTGQ